MVGRNRSEVFDRSVFVNCPFDAAYLPLLHACLFTIHDCGFVARSALEANGSGETRLAKIVRIIGESRFSIHDICRVEWSAEQSLPRFNMPFECGLAVGAASFGSTRRGHRDFLLLAAERFQDKQTLSDLAGQDASYHDHQPALLIKAVRKFLAAKNKELWPEAHRPRGDVDISQRLRRFEADLPAMAARVSITIDEMRSLDYVPEWLELATRWQWLNVR